MTVIYGTTHFVQPVNALTCMTHLCEFIQIHHHWPPSSLSKLSSVNGECNSSSSHSLLCKRWMSFHHHILTFMQTRWIQFIIITRLCANSQCDSCITLLCLKTEKMKIFTKSSSLERVFVFILKWREYKSRTALSLKDKRTFLIFGERYPIADLMTSSYLWFDGQTAISGGITFDITN